MGNLEKIVLVFDEAFWGFSRELLVYLAQNEGENPVFFDLTEDAGAPTLVVLYGGGHARAMQAIDPSVADPVLVETALAALEETLARTVPRPTHTYVTHWTRDPFAHGSYAFIPRGASPSDYETVAEPVGERLLFAGEHTFAPYRGTVPGAFLSGLREARRLGGAALPGL